MRHVQGLLIGLILAAASSALAQRPLGPGAQFRWGSVDVLVAADSGGGVLLWATTTGDGTQIFGHQKQYFDFFDPDSAGLWAVAAETFLDSSPPSHAYASEWFYPHLLTGRAGVVLFMGFHWTGERWDDQPTLYFAGPGGRDPIALRGFRPMLRDFCRQILAQARLSSAAPSATGAEMKGNEGDSILVTLSPALRDRPPRMSYPAALREEDASGMVWATFLVDTTGLIRGGSFRALLSDHPALTDYVRHWVQGLRFVPGRMGGRPVTMRVNIPFTFVLTHSVEAREQPY